MLYGLKTKKYILKVFWIITLKDLDNIYKNGN